MRRNPLSFSCGENESKGVLLLPDAAEGKRPCVLYAHELGSTHASGTRWARALTEAGFAFYAFDFRNGSPLGQNGHALTEMSALTERDELLRAAEMLSRRPELDSRRLCLYGVSQGGMAAALAAAAEPERFAFLVCLNAAFDLPDALRGRFGTPERVPERFRLFDRLTVGRRYALDLWDLDPAAELARFPKPVLLLHGKEDTLVSPSVSERAARWFPRAEALVLPGLAHGFAGAPPEAALTALLAFLKRNG